MKCSIAHFIPTLRGGGAEKQLLLLASAQGSAGLDVTVCYCEEGVFMDRLRSSNVKLLKLTASSKVGLALEVNRVIGVGGFDIVQSWLPLMDVLVGIASARSSVAWVLTERASSESYESFRLLYSARHSLAGFSSAVVANSEAGLKHWHAKLSSQSRPITEVIRNGLDPEVLTFRTPMRHCIPPALACVGRLTHQKAPEIVMAAVALLKGEECKVKFFGDGDMRPTLERAIGRLHARCPAVELCDFDVGWHNPSNHLSAVISASRFEGCPNVLLEAAAAGIPLLLSAIPEHLEIFPADAALYFRKNSSDELADAVRRFLNEPVAPRRARVDRARAISNTMSTTQMAARYNDVYRRLLTSD